MAIEPEILPKGGSGLTVQGTQIAQGRDAAKEVLKADDSLYADIETEVKAALDKAAGK